MKTSATALLRSLFLAGLVTTASLATAIAQPAVKPYPLKTCIVTDNDLGSMGEDTSITHEGREIKFCCAPCEKKFLKNPARYLPKLEPATAKPVESPATPAPARTP